ncbi:hypothetical protein Pmani_028529 [Petrolisthes manimaculis]|uniref:Succinate dehydrogenase assembly factor 4, mitochondrial n=1 Tax=Petrolisthes manimaculis TaxID=1843537 RepID=A0AAE1TVL5_9EUCA|nr:hypothetical protein Pmani_028529 [Petrolisthes manimaculis]
MLARASFISRIRGVVIPVRSVAKSAGSSGEGESCGRSAEPLRKPNTPIGKLDDGTEVEEGRHPQQEKEPLEAFPDNVNPSTGELGGPRGPEPTRYGDWERKGRVTDF